MAIFNSFLYVYQRVSRSRTPTATAFASAVAVAVAVAITGVAGRRAARPNAGSSGWQ